MAVERAAGAAVTPQQARGARITGSWAMPLMAFGFVVAVLPGVVFVVVVLIFALIGLVTGGLAGGLLIGFFAAIFGGVIATNSPWLIVVPLVLGLVAFVGGSWGSVRALRKLGIGSPRKATWSAFGVGLATQTVFAAVLWVVLAILYVVLSSLWTDGEVPIFFTGSPEDFASPLFAREIIFYALTLGASALVGVLYWPIFARVTARV